MENMKQGFNDQITDLVQIEIPRLLKDLLKEAFQTKQTAPPSKPSILFQSPSKDQLTR